MAPGLRRGGRAAAGRAVGRAERRAAAAAVARSRGHRPARGRAHRRARRRSAQFERTRARRAARPQRPPADRRHRGRLAATASHVDGAANSIFALAPGGRVVGRYDKAHLVPYGEYLPMRPLLSAIGLSRLAPGDIDFTAGPGPRTIDLGGQWGKVGFQLCYEIIFSGHVVDEQQPPRLHLQPVERRLVRPLGPAAASRPGAAARRRGRPARCFARRRPGSAR